MDTKRNLISDAFEYDLDEIAGASELGNETALYLRERLTPVESIARLMARRVEEMPADELLAEVRGLLTDWRLTHPSDARIERVEKLLAGV